MVIQESRLIRQREGIERWKKVYKGQGCLECCTGFGKTYVAIMNIQSMNKNKPEYTTIVTVPSEVLYNDWVDPIKGHIKTHNLKNVEVYIINTLVKLDEIKCDFLILDEIHRYGSEQFSRVFDIVEYKFILGLTATIERLDGKHDLIKKYAPIYDTVTLEEAEANGWISKFKIFNFGIVANIEEDEEYQKWHKQFVTNFAKFEGSFDLMLACGTGDNNRCAVRFYPNTETPFATKATYGFETRFKTGREWREWFGSKMGWRGEEFHSYSPKALFAYSSLGRKAMRERKLYVYRHPKKIVIIKQLLKYLKGQAILFGEDTQIANQLEKELGTQCRAYHSKLTTVIRREERIKVYKTKPSVVTYKKVKYGPTKLKREIIKEFEEKKFRVLSTVRALDEGFNVNGIEIAIQHSFNSSKRQNNQRTGRSLRLDTSNPDKVAVIINLYIRDSQEENWLKANQTGVATVNVRSVEEILTHLGISY